MSHDTGGAFVVGEGGKLEVDKRKARSKGRVREAGAEAKGGGYVIGKGGDLEASADVAEDKPVQYMPEQPRGPMVIDPETGEKVTEAEYAKRRQAKRDAARKAIEAKAATKARASKKKRTSAKAEPQPAREIQPDPQPEPDTDADGAAQEI